MLLLVYAIILFFSLKYYRERGLGAALSYAGGMQALFMIIDHKLLPFWLTLVFALLLGVVISGIPKKDPS